MHQSNVTRRALVLGSLAAAGAAIPLVARAQDGTPDASPVTDVTAVASATPETVASPEAAASPSAAVAVEWPLYGRDLTGDRAVTGAGIDSGNVAGLGQLWEVRVGGPVNSTPVIAAGVAYCGSYDGTLYAIDVVSGGVVWTYATGAAVPEPNLGIPLGITGSAAVVGDTVYVGDAAATVHAIDATSGEARWTRQVDTQANASIWSSPVVTDGTLYIGVASVAKQPGFRGSVVALDAATGDVRWQTFMVPEGADGAGVFAVPAIDESRGLLVVGTQNAYTANPAPYGNPLSVVALDLAGGEIRWATQAPEHTGATAPTDDVGFSASPNLITAEVEGAARDLVAIGQKSGAFWALDRDSGQVVWQAIVSPAGFLGGMEGSSAAANGVIAVPATDWPEFEGPAAGMVTALDAATGTELWSAKQTAPAASPTAVSDDVVFHAGFDGILHAYELMTGTELWSFELGASVSGGIAVAEGVVVLGAATPQFAPFIEAGDSIRAFGFGGEPATPVAPASPEPATPAPVEPTVPASPEVPASPSAEPTVAGSPTS